MKRWVVLLAVLGALHGADARKRAVPRPRSAPATLARSVDLRPHRSVVEPGSADPGHNVAVPAGEPERGLAQRLDGIVGSAWLKSAVNGIYVVDAATGRELYVYGADRQLNPASNTKLVSTATAFASLGADFTYATRLLGPPADEDGVVHGDVQLVGQADPTLGPGDLRDLAAHLAGTGIRRITGDVVVSTDERDALARAWVTITVTGGEREGERARVRLTPDSAFFLVDNGAVTRSPAPGKKARRGGVSVEVRLAPGKDGERMRIGVSGRVRPGQEVEVTRAVPARGLFAAHTLRAAIVSSGIEIGGGAQLGRGQPPGDALELARHESVPLARLAAMINKPSNNYLADRLLLTVAGETLGERTMTAGVQAMGAWLSRIGITPGSYRFENGSGLSHTIHVSARQLAQVLLAGAKDEHIGRAWIDSLAIGGRDGTLRSRFAGHPVAGRVLGKTGTLDGVSALSGFVTLGDRTVCFAVLTNGFRDRRKPQVRASQAAIVDAIYGYLSDGAPPPPALVTDPGTTVDSEDLDAPDDGPAEPPAAPVRGKPGVEL